MNCTIKLLLFLLLFTSFNVLAQTNRYDKVWDKVEKFEVEGKPKSAMELVNDIQQKSLRREEFNQFIKASIFRWKFLNITQEDSENIILAEINSALTKVPKTQSAILQAVKAKLLTDYYEDNTWRIYQRSKTDNVVGVNIGSWDIKTLVEQISNAYQFALKDKGILKNTPVSEVSAVIDAFKINRHYRPTLYDVIVYEAIDFHTSSFRTVTQPEEPFLIDDAIVFANSETFRTHKFKTTDTLFSKFKAVHYFQELESLHQNDNNPDAFVYAQLKRLRFVKNQFTGDETDKLYIEALQKLSEDYGSKTIDGLIKFHIAETYVEIGQHKYSLSSLKNDDNLIKAVNICKNVIEKFPNSDGAERCRILKDNIQRFSLSAKSEAYIPSNSHSRMLIDYKNLDSITLRVFKIPHHKLPENRWRYLSQTAIDTLIQTTPLVFENQFPLKNPKDYQTHSTEVLTPKLEPGAYLFYLDNEKMKDSKSYGHAFSTVTDFTLNTVEYSDRIDYQILNRKTGLPISDLSLTILQDKIKPYKSTKKTNNLGEVSLKKYQYTNRQTELYFKDGADSLYLKENINRHYSSNDNSPRKEAKTALFLDRGIYRPGQTVHFKGILLQNQNDETSIVPNEFVEVYIEDANYDVIFTEKFKTNEFGSFSGKFKLPSNTLTGSFNMYTDEEYKSESKFWDSVNNYNEDYTSFQVEEYKRPSFEVTFEDIKKIYQPNDSVTIIGNAKAFLGSNITDADVFYKVVRQTQPRYWWYNRANNESKKIVEGDTLTDAEGNFSFSFIAENDPENDDDPIYNFNITAEVTDLNGETRSETMTLKISNKNILADFNIPETINLSEDLNISASTKNLNGNLVPTSGTLNLYKAKTDETVYRKRLWPAPEIQQIPEADFKRYFPHEPYTTKSDSLVKGALVAEIKFDTDGFIEEKIITEKDWKTGQYILILNAETDQQVSVTIEKPITIADPGAQYLPDGDLFRYTILNEEPHQDGFIHLKLQTALDSLPVIVSLFDEQEIVYQGLQKVNGRQDFKIPLKSPSKTLQLRFKWFWANSFHREESKIIKKRKKEFLTLETKTFRNKLKPGLDEEWAFTISDQDDENPQAEVLATMYDASLDQFVNNDWSNDIEFYDRDYSRAPYLNFETDGISNFSVRNNTFIWQYRVQRFDAINYFGFSFNANNRVYKQYLNKLKQPDQKTLKGNTKGIVTDESGLPIPGVTVLVQGTNKGTQTDFDGQFALDTKKKGDVLVFSYIGYVTKAIVAEDSSIYVSLNQDSANLEEVVVTAQGIKRGRNTSNMPAPLNALNGQVAGVQVQSATNGSETNIIIRGYSSINSTNQPLFIIDGIPFINGDGSSGALKSLNQNDILNIEVLKGLSATSLYGQKGRNGVVIITTKKGLEAVSDVKARKNLDETAFFFPHLKTDKSGSLSFNFTSPEALTRWKFRLLGHTKNAISGRLEREVVTQKDLSVVPNAPRFLRETDTIVFQAKIANLTNNPMVGNAILKLFNGLTMQPIEVKLQLNEPTKSFQAKAKGNTSVSWKFSIPEGVQAVTYRVLAKAGSFTDGEENTLPVLTNRTLVTESIPFLVRPDTEESYTLKNLKETTSTTLTNHKLTLEYTTNPVWQAIQALPYLMEFPFECSEQTFSRLYANSVSAHILNSNPKIKTVFDKWKGNGVLKSDLEKNAELKSILIAETPWLRDAQSETEQKKRLALLFDLEKTASKTKEILNKLKQIQSGDGGFPWFSGGRSNPYITRHIVAGFGHLNNLGIDVEADDIIKDAISYLDTELITDLKRYSEKDTDSTVFYKQTRNLHWLYARSFHTKDFPPLLKVKKAMDAILKAHKESWLRNSLYDKALLALASKRVGDSKFSTKVLESLEETAVKSEVNGMYWKENTSGWRWYNAPIETHALIIEAFSEIAPKTYTESIEELKIWLLQQKRTSRWTSTKATANATYALLMRGVDFVSAKTATEITVGTKPVEPEATEAGTGYFKTSWLAEDIQKPMATTTIKNTGETTGYGGVYWQYFEDLDKIKSAEKGLLNVEKGIFRKDPKSDNLKSISKDTRLQLGDLVTIRLTVTSKSDLDFIHLKDLRASGFEPVDVLSEYKYQDGLGYYQSTKDVATHFFFDQLPKGTYVFEYQLRANNSGQFSNGNSSIESLYAPEFSSHTKGMRLKIMAED